MSKVPLQLMSLLGRAVLGAEDRGRQGEAWARAGQRPRGRAVVRITGVPHVSLNWPRRIRPAVGPEDLPRTSPGSIVTPWPLKA